MSDEMAKLLLLLAVLSGIAKAEPNTPMCIKNTGGTCLTRSCDASRGPTSCELGGRCFCSGADQCVGLDMNCHSSATSPYQVIGGLDQYYKIRNARWPQQYLFVSSLGKVCASRDQNSDQGAFQLVMPPSSGSSPGVLVYTKKWATSAVRISPVHDQHSTHYYANSVYVAGSVWNAGRSVPMHNLLIEFVAPPQGPGPCPNSTMFMINGYQTSWWSLYIPSTHMPGTAVSVMKGDPGAAGYWFFDPEPPATFTSSWRQFNGARCSFACGSVGACS